MQLLYPVALALAALASAQSAAFTAVYNDVTSIDDNVLNLIAKLNKFQGGILANGPLVLDMTKVHLATRQGYYDAVKLPKSVSEDDARTLVDHVNKTLAIDNPRAVEILKTKKMYFDQIGATTVVKSGLQVLLNDHLAFSNEVLERSPPSTLAAGNEVVDKISNALQSGINYFST